MRQAVVNWLAAFLGVESPFVIMTYSGSGTCDDPWRDKVAHGDLDAVESTKLYLRLEIAKRIKFGGSNQMCERCKCIWQMERDHTTWLTEEKGTGCIALCGTCWAELKTAENRMPYYKRRWAAYWSHNPWERYEAAVNEEDAEGIEMRRLQNLLSQPVSDSEKFKRCRQCGEEMPKDVRGNYCDGCIPF